MSAIEHVENNWPIYLTAFLVTGAVVVWGLMFYQWASLPSCQTVAEYSTGLERPEGSRYRETVGNLRYDCRVPKYLPTR